MLFLSNIQSGGSCGFSHIDSKCENNPMFGVHRYGSENPNYGNRWTDESRMQMSNTIKNNGGHHGENNPMFGKSHSEESKEKMREARAKHNFRGENSPLYGRHEDHPCYGLYWWCDGINPPVKARKCPGEQYHRGRK